MQKDSEHFLEESIPSNSNRVKTEEENKQEEKEISKANPIKSYAFLRVNDDSSPAEKSNLSS